MSLQIYLYPIVWVFFRQIQCGDSQLLKFSWSFTPGPMCCSAVTQSQGGWQMSVSEGRIVWTSALYGSNFLLGHIKAEWMQWKESIFTFLYNSVAVKYTYCITYISERYYFIYNTLSLCLEILQHHAKLFPEKAAEGEAWGRKSYSARHWNPRCFKVFGGTWSHGLPQAVYKTI